MSLLVVGSLALDSLRTPFGQREDALGGSAVYFSLAASLFTRVNLVGIVGSDFPKDGLDLLKKKGVSLDGLTTDPGKTFRWSGYYYYDLNEAHTIETQLNVFAGFRPVLPESYRDAEYVFLANIDPELQSLVLDQMRGPKLVACDTMNYWIEKKREALQKVIGRVDLMFVNEGEARQLAKEPNLMKAAKAILGMGAKRVVIKRGEHGAMLFDGEGVFTVPAYMMESIVDPTGAGDTFAGGLLGYVCRMGEVSGAVLRKAVVYGSVLASFTVEDFGVDRLKSVTEREAEARYREIERMTAF